jgi:GAF domain-containing protein
MTAANSPMTAEETINYLLGELIDLTTRQRRATQLLLPTKAPRTAWILQPNRKEWNFRCVHYFPPEPVYEDVKERHCPAMWNRDAFDAVYSEWERAKSTLRGEAFTLKERELRNRLRKVASLTGYVAANGGPRFFPTLDVTEADSSYLECLGPLAAPVYKFRSGAGMPLAIDDTVVGVLMLYDTLYGGFLEADAATITIFSRLLAPLVRTVYPLTVARLGVAPRNGVL